MAEQFVLDVAARQWRSDHWQWCEDLGDAAAPDAGTPMLIPASVWLADPARFETALAGGTLGLWLTGDADLPPLSDVLPRLPLVAIRFDSFADGRGYSLAALLRSHYGFGGSLRACGDIGRDQFNYLLRVGFTELQPPAGRYDSATRAEAIASLDDFRQPYQAAIVPDAPLFQRTARGVTA